MIIDLCSQPHVKYRFIDQHKENYSVQCLCQTLQVSAQGYYRWRQRPPSARCSRNEALVEQICSVHQQSRQTYGSPRVHQELLAQGVQTSRKRVARLMRLNGLCAKTRRRYRTTTNSDHGLPVAQNLLNRRFRPAAPNQAWVTDITYVPTQEGWLYLCVYLDLFSRRIVGWAMSERMTSELVTSALSMAVQQRRPVAGLLVHSDRGSQYASDQYQKQLQRQGFLCSMSRKGNCWDNSVAESFFHTLKGELIPATGYQTRSEARREIFAFIEGFYNRTRRHSTLAYQTPLLYERQYQQRGHPQTQDQAAEGQQAYLTIN